MSEPDFERLAQQWMRGFKAFDVEGGVPSPPPTEAEYRNLRSSLAGVLRGCWQLAQEQRGKQCQEPPPGWSCSRAKGHPGPCAATPEAKGSVSISLVCGVLGLDPEKVMAALKAALPPDGQAPDGSPTWQGEPHPPPSARDPRPLLTRLRDGALSDPRIVEFSDVYGLDQAAEEGLYDLVAALLEEALQDKPVVRWDPQGGRPINPDPTKGPWSDEPIHVEPPTR